jgi:hypothetical protein
LRPLQLPFGEVAFFCFSFARASFLLLFLSLACVLPSGALVESPLGAKVKKKILFFKMLRAKEIKILIKIASKRHASFASKRQCYLSEEKQKCFLFKQEEP